MEGNKIKIHQAFYGEANKAHSKIKQTINDPELTSFLLTFTDRPSSLPPGVELMPYLSGSAYAKYYVLTKTFADKSATRAGMVFTHVLIFSLSDILLANNLESILSLFVQSTESKSEDLTELQINVSDENEILESRIQPKYIQQTISAFINGINPILFSGDVMTFSKALQQIWNSPYIESRKKLKFRTSFSPSDIENAKDLTIVSIQKNFLTKWQGQTIIQSEDQENVEIISHSEALFLGHKKDNPFYDFVLDLNADLADVQKYGQYERLFSDYISIEKIDDANILRQDIRVLSKICPSPADGKAIKEKFVIRLSTLISTKKDTNVKALRNIDWTAFNGSTGKGEEIVSQFILSEIANANEQQTKILSELICLAVEETPKNWWHSIISGTLNSAFNKQTTVIVDNIWKLINFSEATLKNTLSVITTNTDCDTVLRKHLPEKLRVETCKTIIVIAQEKNWYLFHAYILLKYLPIEESIEKQLQMESTLPLTTSLGLKYLVEKLPDTQLIELSIRLNNDKLIELSAEAIDKDISLVNNLNLSIAGWLEIWTTLVIKTRRVFNGLIGKEQSVVHSILDLLINGNAINSVVLNLIANTPFSDISDYENRNKVWTFLPALEKEKFLASTTHGVLTQLVTEKIEPSSIEPEIVARIKADSFMTKFLYDNRSNIKPVLKIYQSFDKLRDNFLSDYIHRYTGEISEDQSKVLGRIVMKNNFFKTARTIYDKAKYYDSFYPAYQECKNIVSLNWWESLGFGKAPVKSSSTSKIVMPIISGEQTSRAELPTIVILTAIHEEYTSVRLHLKEVVEVIENDTSYEAGIFEFNRKEIAKVIIRECGAKNTVASQETERAIQYFKPALMLFVGIAGSRKPNDFSIGDVIFPEKVYSYEGGKAEKGAFMARPDLVNANYTLYEIAKRERRKPDWKTLIKNHWQVEIKADLGVIASGEQLIEHYDSEIGKIIKEHYNETSAVEMEGFGFAKAATRQGRQTNNVMIGVVRGISDIIEQPSGSKKKENNSDRRPANAKLMASDTAAAFAYWLILKAFE